MKVIIAGSRSFRDRKLLASVMDEYVNGVNNVIVLSGGALGADRLGEDWAYSRRLTYQIYHPDWEAHGKAAGPLRNREMARDATDCVVFWDGKSLGTKSMIEIARQKKLKLKMVRFKDEA